MKEKSYMAADLIVKEWLYRADQDYGYASTSLAEEFSFFDLICFHFQQAAEKYLKAYIVKHDLPLRKIHDLVELVEICKIKEPGFKVLREECLLLNPFYVETRYAEPVFKIHTKEEALYAQNAASKIQQFVRKKLGIKGEISAKEMKSAEKETEQEFRQLDNNRKK